MSLSENSNRGMGIETGNRCSGYIIASLREGGGPRSGGRSLRDFKFKLTSLSRTLPQSATLTAPSRREPFFVFSSAYINKVPTNHLIGLWDFFVMLFSPLRKREKTKRCSLFCLCLKVFGWGYGANAANNSRDICVEVASTLAGAPFAKGVPPSYQNTISVSSLTVFA